MRGAWGPSLTRFTSHLAAQDRKKGPGKRRDLPKDIQLTGGKAGPGIQLSPSWDCVLSSTGAVLRSCLNPNSLHHCHTCCKTSIPKVEMQCFAKLFNSRSQIKKVIK